MSHGQGEDPTNRRGRQRPPMKAQAADRDAVPPSPQPAESAEDLSNTRERIALLRRQAEELIGSTADWASTDHLPPDVEEAFWRQIIAYELAEPVDLFAMLVEDGILLPPPPLIRGEDLTAKLWEVIYYLASVGCYLEHTDHLCDHQLYALLYDEILREPAILFPDDPCYAYHIDIIGSGHEDDTENYLRFYASEEERRRWQDAWLGDEIPARQPRLSDRDRLMPRPPGHPGRKVM